MAFHSSDVLKRLKDNKITKSISSKGSGVDNCPIESFFSALNPNISIYTRICIYNYLEAIVKEYMNYYNKLRLQEKIKELAPIQFRKQALSTLFFTCPYLTNELFWAIFFNYMRFVII